jgi:endonuclease G, mitochondrial
VATVAPEGRRRRRGVRAVHVVAGASALLPAAVGVVATVASPEPARVVVAAPDLPVAPQPEPSASPTETVADVAPARIVAQGDPAACLQAYAAVDYPYQRGDGAAPPETVVCRQTYVVGYDSATHDPDWVMEHLTPTVLAGSAKRRDNFRQDPLLAGADANNPDYTRSGYDRGHQAPAGDAKFAQPAMDDSFFFSNMAPQVGIGFNRGAWKYLEENVRAWVTCGGHDDLYVFTGPIYGAANAPAIGADRVAVPRAFFKIVYDAHADQAVGFVLPNVKIGSTIKNLQEYVQPISAIETETGLDFFRSWSFRRQMQLEGEPGVAWGHVGDCSGDAGD